MKLHTRGQDSKPDLMAKILNNGPEAEIAKPEVLSPI